MEDHCIVYKVIVVHVIEDKVNKLPAVVFNKKNLKMVTTNEFNVGWLNV